MSTEEGWIGVDLDGTLAQYDHWRGADHIGEPVPEMLFRVKKWLADGRRVKIFTARVSRPPFPIGTNNRAARDAIKRIEDAMRARRAIRAWCEKHLGTRLEITNVKDYAMLTLYDDRAVQVEANTGRIVGYDTRGLS